MRNLFLCPLLALVAFAPLMARANPIAKLCRASMAIREDYRDFAHESSRAVSATCFHAGRIAGATEDGMTFRERAREKTPPALLAMADEAVERAKALRAQCTSQDNGDRAALAKALLELAGDQDGSLNTRILKATCEIIVGE